jgi:hypothetical protein
MVQMRGSSWAAGAGALVALALLASPARALADQTIASLSAPAPVSALGGRVAWSAYEPATRTYRLMTEVGGAVSAVPVRPRGGPFDVDLGLGSNGAIVAAYSRCKTEPPRRDPAIGNIVAQMPDWSRGRGCDLYRFDFATGRERKLASASSPHASEFLPTVWRTRVAFARVYEQRRGKAGDRAYLYTRSLAHAGRTRRLPAGARSTLRFCSGRPARCRLKTEPGPTSVDLGGRRLAFGWDSGSDAGPTSSVYLDTLRSRRTDKKLIERVVSGDIQAMEIIAPVAGLGRVTWTLTLFGDQTASFSRRYRIARGDRTEAPLPIADPLDSFIRPVIAGEADGERVLYLSSGLTPVGEPCTPVTRCIADPGCSPAQPCPLRSAEGLQYTPASKRP